MIAALNSSEVIGLEGIDSMPGTAMAWLIDANIDGRKEY
jgi:hypothetical protein